MEWVLLEKEKAKKIARLLERYGRIQRKRAWHKRSSIKHYSLLMGNARIAEHGLMPGNRL